MRDFIVMGLGELGQLYASAALKCGLRVLPVTRAIQPAHALASLAIDTPLLVAVGENDLESALASLPAARHDSLILLQNELFPMRWARFTHAPTVMVPWLLKKKHKPLLVARSTPVYGRHAALVSELHQALGFAAETLPNPAALAQAIVDKYAFILTVNALGQLRDLSLGEWLAHDPRQVERLARDAAALGACLVVEGQAERHAIDPNASTRQVHAAMLAMSDMRAKGRTAAARIERALANAKRFELSTPALGLLAKS